MTASTSSPSAPPRVLVDDVKFDRVRTAQAVRRIVKMAKRRDRPRYVCTGNLDHLVIAERDPEFREAYRKADLVVADGKPIVWLSKLGARQQEETLPERVAGSDDPEAQAAEILRESDERTDDPSGTRAESSQTPGTDGA